MIRFVRSLVFLIALIFVLASSTARADFPFDPDGPGPKPAVQVGAFDFLIGNSLAKGAIGSDTWTLYYQASVASLTDKDTRQVQGTGLNQDHEITVVVAISVKNISAPPFLSYELNPGGVNFVRIYHDDKVNADPLAGTGYADGELILESHATDALQGALWVRPVTFLLDMFGVKNDWPATKTLQGLGSLSCSSVVSSFDQEFFKVGQGQIDRININSSQVAPFNQMQPSKLFWNGTDTFAPAIGAINAKDGPDALMQADANASFLIE